MFTFPCYHEDNTILKEVMTDSCSQIDFYGNKVLKMEKELDTKWYNSLRELN